jgi:hypothetical protein
MSSTLIRTYHYTCDRQGCDAHGSADKIPDGWRYVSLTKWHEPGKTGEKHPNDTEIMLLCPPCVAWLKTQLFVRAKKEAA